uniref:C-type lectin domain-containing protein n=1 Tax=Panagrolaimus davidi TaxID=227884 RepID=A0A914PZJ8_9BILA
MFENLFLSEKAHTIFTSDNFWFGANNLVGNWSWMDNTPFDFSDWGKGEPKNISNCGAVRIQDGKWITDDCFNAKPFICKTYMPPILSTTTTTTTKTTTIKPTPSAQPCSDPWKYYDKTKSCYKILNNLNWQDANNACFKDGGGHLASIHSLDENIFITNLIPFNPNYHQCSNPNLAWFGLYTVDNEASWNWIDNTPFNFSDWAPGRPGDSGFHNCGLLHGTNCGASYGKWGDGMCDAIVGYSVCKKPAFS